jgi:oxygen-independent coproporphyrinogen-3 oxidase
VGEAAEAAPADTLFFGGGTPSLLDAAEIRAIVRACRGAFAMAGNAEITLEANPETVSREALEALRDAGVNRLSFGVQSFRDEELRRLGRIHDSRRARQAFADARSAGFDNISLDLMMWLPGQSLADWETSVEGLIALGPEHASLYMLELYPNAPLRDEMARSGWSLSPDDDAALMYERAMERLESVGYEHYEISNVALAGRRSRHNLKYWQDGEWFGFGPGAHSTWRGARWKNVPGTADYVQGVAAGRSVAIERRDLTPQERWQEAVMMGLRLSDGIGVEEMRLKYGLDILARYGDHLQPSVDAGLLIIVDGRLRLTRQGMLMANEVLAVFF